MFLLCFHIAHNHIPLQIAHVLRMVCLLTMTKPSNGVRLVAVKEPLYWFTNHALCFQFYDAFATHFFLHQFGVVMKDICEVIIHDIKCTLNLHLDWVILQLDMANVFNLVLRGAIFQKLYITCRNIIQFIPFVHAFYAFESPLFYNHHNREGNVIIIPSAMGIW